MKKINYGILFKWLILLVIVVITSACINVVDSLPDSKTNAEKMSHGEGHSGHDDKGHGATQQQALLFTSREHAVTQDSPTGKYKLSLFCNDSAIPLQKIHSWTLHVEDAAGKPVDNLKIFVSGGMPMHRHGFSTRPRVSDHLGNGDYRVEGIKFHMPGHWEMRFNLNKKDKPMGRDLEQVVFTIHRK